MSVRLILTRHAKSSWDDPMMDDHDRPLNQRGRKSAAAIGLWLAENGYVPDQALVSSAQRTRETWELMAEAFDAQPALTVRKDLYHAEPEAMLAALREADARVVVMVGHNPGTAYFAQAVVSSMPADARFSRYPTGATAIIDFPEDDWGSVTWRRGKVIDLAFPRDLIS